MSMYQLPEHSLLRKKQFLYGVATASFQIEGAADSRLPCIWDTFCATAGKIKDGSDGKTACDHLRLWRDDLDLIESLGVDAYRLSLSWPRLIQLDGELNPAGLQFYIDLLDELKARNIKSFVTLYHWDLPQHLEDKGGWLNRDTAYKFADYVEKVSTALGDRVYSYATLNEPFCSSFLGYEAGIHAPGLTGRGNGRKSAHHLLLAHGLGLQVLRRTAPHSLNGLVLNFTPCYPHTDSPADKVVAEQADQYYNQWYLQPVMTGQYPEYFNRLTDEEKPVIEAGDMALISQPLDFLGVNFYTRHVYTANADHEFAVVEIKDAEKTDIGWEIYPQAFYDLLTSMHQKYKLPPIYITENGAAGADKLENGQVQDEQRQRYYQLHLNALHQAVEAGVNVQGYFAWSLMDNFEWAEGYSKRFGIVYVDYNTQQRTIKQSGHAYRQLLQSRV
ncbi:GH1 family beta-glucosidase [Rheinheimera sp.]|uniref:GH1 family beta-glucosidase n=1 Tax=Rheinheimera sp. TaxID=1869214 RepID=UPI00307E94D2